ncbi:hypothetical protein [Frankia sp. AgKG'84/4]|uniref:hypothetical protein n=1 Tax=Frankia sp. AgKG'84/4 TaxID=573490 RepID=UPI00200D2E5E|nr:hypothetical protein [Frankia sp. AgKG'84/4]MCL9796228.1 hypothetical protein [Frankia sp. AgKG'84/4]
MTPTAGDRDPRTGEDRSISRQSEAAAPDPRTLTPAQLTAFAARTMRVGFLAAGYQAALPATRRRRPSR